MSNTPIHPYENRYSLDDLRHGRVPKQDLYSVIVDLGKANMREAEPDIEPFLNSPEANLRGAALFTLALWWQLPQHRQTALHFLERDPFNQNRASAASYLGSYYRDTRDNDIEATLAKIVLNPDEDFFVRRSAYASMREIIQSNPREAWRIQRSESKEFAEMVDWDFVREHAE